ncbi:MAG: class I SAM-dependent methyltransferase [Minwuia sp.]|nr:class I SAM-dependent methyltransferase [Minwuia sp.]
MMAGDAPDHSRRALVPDLTGLLDAVLQEIRFDSAAEPTVCVLGDVAGLFTGMVASRLPRAAITLIEPAEALLVAARDRLDAHPHLTFRAGDPLRVRLPKPADAVVSLFAAHHMTDAQKIDFYSRSYQSLRPGGVLVHATRIAGEDEVLQRRHHWTWLAALRASGVDESGMARALAESRDERLSPLSTHLDWMRKIGLAHVDCGYRRGAFAVLSGEMPTDPQARPRNLFSVERMLKRG